MSRLPLMFGKLTGVLGLSGTWGRQSSRQASVGNLTLLPQHLQVDSDEVLRIKTLIRYCEARSGGR